MQKKKNSTRELPRPAKTKLALLEEHSEQESEKNKGDSEVEIIQPVQETPSQASV